MAGTTKDFEELLDAFLRHDVRFVIVGAHALAHHAKPRYTTTTEAQRGMAANSESNAVALECGGGGRRFPIGAEWIARPNHPQAC
jgi:hypothetical protein